MGRLTALDVLSNMIATNARQRELIDLQREEMIELIELLSTPEMTIYSQRDPRWRDVVFAGGMTLGQAGCYVTCVAMVASLAGYTDSPPIVAEHLREVEAFEGAELAHPERISDAYPRLEWRGRVDWRDVPADMGEVLDQLNVGPVITEVDFVPRTSKLDQHFVVAEQLTPTHDDLCIVDPWDGASTRLLERYALNHWNLARSIYGLRLLRAVAG